MISSTARSAPVTVVDYIVSTIAEYTDHLFAVGGANIVDLYDAVHRSPEPLTGIVAKHEFGAATMADEYTRATNRLGVVAATSGGGALNLIAVLGESFDSRIPVLALVGQPPIAGEGCGVFQDMSGGARLDAEQIFASVSRYCAKLTGDIAEQLRRAITIALDQAGMDGLIMSVSTADVVSLVDDANYLLENIVSADYFACRTPQWPAAPLRRLHLCGSQSSRRSSGSPPRPASSPACCAAQRSK
ncbi:thiamine pyrophosphate-binding protein [Nocardia nepalensis]|uniref:thiamine pyrophosphate-binding protein n=1 Tax=Nocardia nepalensis TaxID=3375448 RepID=UPI003B67F16B